MTFRAPLTTEELDARLATLGLRREESPEAPPPSKNRTVLARSGNRRVLVKLADGPGNVGPLREGSVLERIGPIAAAEGSPLHLPRVFAFDPAHGVLALEWLKGSETLHHYHRRTREYPKAIARLIGASLGHLHRHSREQPWRFALADGFREEGDLLECFLRMRTDFYARLSQAGLDFFAEVQAANAAMRGLQVLSDAQAREGDACLLHGDMRQANLLKLGDRVSAPIVFIDWELSLWGDGARDLGSLISEYVLQFLMPEHPSEVLSRSTLAQFIRPMLGAYSESRGERFTFDGEFEERVVRWIGASLLIAVYGITHYTHSYDERARAIARKALDMVGAPSRWPSTLWGG